MYVYKRTQKQYKSFLEDSHKILHYRPDLLTACSSANPLLALKKLLSGFTKDMQVRITKGMDRDIVAEGKMNGRRAFK